MVFRRINRKFVSQIDWQLTIVLLLLCSVGLVLLYSAGFDPAKGDSTPFQGQLRYMAGGFLLFLGCMCVNASFWRRSAYLMYLCVCGMLLLVLTNGIVVNGARRWIELGGMRMQPSEFMKLALILALARLFSGENAPRDGYTLFRMIIPLILMIIPAVLVMEQPDLGTAMTYILIGGSMLLVAGIRWGTLVRMTILGLLLIIPAWQFLLQDYQRQRVLTFMSPEVDPLGKGYHAIQSKIAVGSGALFGKGFLQGTQTQLRFLPEQTTDFIFSVLAEEWGFFGSAAAIILYTLLIVRLLNIALRSDEAFPALVSVGVAAMLFWHVVINIGMVIGIMPVVGITLTLLSYGGSSVITMMAGVGIVAGFSIRRFIFA